MPCDLCIKNRQQNILVITVEDFVGKEQRMESLFVGNEASITGHEVLEVLVHESRSARQTRSFQ